MSEQCRDEWRSKERTQGAVTGLPWRKQLRDDYPTGIRIYGYDGKAGCVADVMFEDDADAIVAAVNTIEQLRTLNEKLAAACNAILTGWGHQDGVSKAVELARAALSELQQPSPSAPAAGDGDSMEAAESNIVTYS